VEGAEDVCYGSDGLGFQCFTYTQALYGPSIPQQNQPPIVGDLVTAQTLTCSATEEDFTGKIALIPRGLCYFYNKSYIAMQQGAIGVILHMSDNNDLVTPLYELEPDEVLIPTVMVSLNSANILKSTPGFEARLGVKSLQPVVTSSPTVTPPTDTKPKSDSIPKKSINEFLAITLGSTFGISVLALLWARHRLKNPPQLPVAQIIAETNDVDSMENDRVDSFWA